MNRFTKLVSSTVAAASLIGALTVTSGSAEARGYPAAGLAAGLIGAAAIGAIAADAYAPRRVYVVHRRHARHQHNCGCVVRIGQY